MEENIERGAVGGIENENDKEETFDDLEKNQR